MIERKSYGKSLYSITEIGINTCTRMTYYPKTDCMSVSTTFGRHVSFSDGWTAEGIDEDGNTVKISDTQRYKCLGNAVTTTVIQFIARHIITKGFPHPSEES